MLLPLLLPLVPLSVMLFLSYTKYIPVCIAACIISPCFAADAIRCASVHRRSAGRVAGATSQARAHTYTNAIAFANEVRARRPRRKITPTAARWQWHRIGPPQSCKRKRKPFESHQFCRYPSFPSSMTCCGIFVGWRRPSRASRRNRPIRICYVRASIVAGRRRVVSVWRCGAPPAASCSRIGRHSNTHKKHPIHHLSKRMHQFSQWHEQRCQRSHSIVLIFIGRCPATATEMRRFFSIFY